MSGDNTHRHSSITCMTSASLRDILSTYTLASYSFLQNLQTPNTPKDLTFTQISAESLHDTGLPLKPILG